MSLAEPLAYRLTEAPAIPLTGRPVAGGGGGVPANAITTDGGDPITLDDGTTYVTTDA